MSRIGKKPIEIPEGVNVKIEGNKVLISGPLGQLEQEILEGIKVKKEDNLIKVERTSDHKKIKAFHGLVRQLIAWKMEGVTKGFKKSLELVGVGFRAEKKDRELWLWVGFSHPVKLKIMEGIEVNIEKNIITVSGIDKQKVGEMAARIRRVKPPEPYKGKGIKYTDEIIRRKPGKAAKAVVGS